MTTSDISRRSIVVGGLATLAAAVPKPLRAACARRQDQITTIWPELFLDLPLDQPKSTPHVLAGRVWSASRAWADNTRDDCGFDANSADLTASISSADIVCLGEVHDNPAHHLFRARLVNTPPGGDRPAGAVFEQIADDQQAGVDRFTLFDRTAARLGTASDLMKFIDWDSSPWSKMADYRPLFEAVIGARLQIYPGDVARSVMKKAAKEGLSSVLSPEEMAQLALDRPLGDAADAASQAEIEGSHCGMLPKQAVPRLAAAQRFRDAHLADAVLRAVNERGRALLFAGNGHVRTDRGVPWYIAQRAPDKRQVSVMLIEAEDGKSDPEVYVPRGPDGKPAADFVVFTPEAKRANPCDTMKVPPQK